MSTLWTPGGERPIRREPPSSSSSEAPPGRAGDQPPSGPAGRPEEEALSEEELAARLEELREQLSRTPAAVVVANHAYQLFELAALHLSLETPQLEEARLAIDALAALVDGLGARLGEAEPQLREGLAQIRLAFVTIQRESSARSSPPS